MYNYNATTDYKTSFSQIHTTWATVPANQPQGANEINLKCLFNWKLDKQLKKEMVIKADIKSRAMEET